MAVGLHEKTGLLIEGVEELTQRIQRCFKTRRGSLPLDRPYGSNLPSRVDKKITPELEIDIYADVADALSHPPNGFNDELKLVKSWLVHGENQVTLSMEIELLFDGSVVEISGLSL